MEFMTLEKIVQNNTTRALLTENYLLDIAARFPWLLEMDAGDTKAFDKLDVKDFVAVCAELAGVMRMLNNHGYKGYQDAINERRNQKPSDEST